MTNAIILSVIMQTNWGLLNLGTNGITQNGEVYRFSEHYAVWNRYVDNLVPHAKAFYGGNIHATVEQKQDAFLKVIGVTP